MRHTIRSYAELATWSKGFAAGSFNLLILVGDPGLQKSTLFREHAADARWIEGTASAFMLFCRLFMDKDKPFVIDDVDQLFNDRAATRLLKCVCQTDNVKRVAWHTAARQLDELGVPREFETRSKVAIIANKFDPEDKNMAAIVDRGIFLEFRPSAAEVHERVTSQGWFKDREILQFVERHIDLIVNPSMRFYGTAKAIKDSKQNWRLALLETWGLDETQRYVVELCQNLQMKTHEKVAAFIAKTGQSRPTFFRIKKRLRLA